MNIEFQAVAAKVKSVLEAESCGHDYYHAERVFKNAMYIQEQELTGDRYVVGVAALVHDLCRPWEKKTGKSHFSEEALSIIAETLREVAVAEEIIPSIIDLVRFHDVYDLTKIPTLSVELQILQDADRLDAIGALGIARTFAFGGANSLTMYEPGENLDFTKPFEENPTHRTTTIAHFYEKLLKLHEGMHTHTGKEWGKVRHTRMEQFLTDFFSEWNADFTS
jgi:uncharacterized protein